VVVAAVVGVAVVGCAIVVDVVATGGLVAPTSATRCVVDGVDGCVAPPLLLHAATTTANAQPNKTARRRAARRGVRGAT
jgi:hypothetical protein